MASYNQLQLIGHITKDPETQSLPSGATVTRFGLATNHNYTDRDGNKQEEVMFIDIDAFGRTGETVAKYLSKGRQVHVVGRLRFRQWEDDQGNKRSKHDMFLERFTFLNDGSGQQGSSGAEDKGTAPVEDDDVPF